MNFATPFDAVRMVSLSMEDCTPSSLVDDDDDMVVLFEAPFAFQELYIYTSAMR